MTSIFWTSILATILGGIIVLVVEYFVIQPLAKRYQKESKYTITGFKSIITKIAFISSGSIYNVIISFIIGIIFTITIAKITNINLATIDIFGSNHSSCGINNTGIVGQVIGNDMEYVVTVTTSPPTSSVITDNNGYFYLCGVSLSSAEQQYTITAISDFYKGSVDITVVRGKTTIAIIQMHYTGY